MTNAEFEHTISFFYPELHKIIINDINNDKYVDLIIYEGYNINGFDINYKFHVSAFNTIDTSAYIDRLLYYTKYNGSKESSLNDFFGFIRDNKDKHMFWFL